MATTSEDERDALRRAALEVTLAESHAALTIDGVPYEVLSLDGREAVSDLFRFDVVCSDLIPGSRASDFALGYGVAPKDLLGRSAELVLYDGFDARRSIQGMVAEARRVVRDQGKVDLRLSIRPNPYPLALSRDSRVFQDMTVPEIVERVLEKLPQKHPYRFELARTYRRHVYTAQYREADYAFIARLLEEEGIYSWFDHEGDDSVLVFSDDSPHAPPLSGGAALDFALETGMLGRQEYVHELASEAHATPTRFTVGSFNPWQPALAVTATEGEGHHEIYDAPAGGPESPEHCRDQAQKRLEIAAAHRFGVSGNASSVRIEPGRVLEIRNHPLYDGRYFVTEVTYEVRQRRAFDGAGGGYRCHFEAIPERVPYRHPEVTPVAEQAGIQSGRVVGPPSEEIHTDERGRVRVQLHWDREGAWDHAAGKWMRVAQRGVGMSMAYPRTGWNVMTLMEEGNVDAPSVLSRVHDAAHPPTYPLPDHKTRTVFRTSTSPGSEGANELRFEDLHGIQEFFVNASRDMNYLAKNDHTASVGRDNLRAVGGNHAVQIGASVVEGVKRHQSVNVAGDEVLEIADDRAKTVGRHETEDIGGDRSLEVGSNVNHVVDHDRELLVKGDVVETAKEGLIKLSSQTAKVVVDGATIHDVRGVHSEQVAADAIRSVGADKTEYCRESYTLEVNHALSERIVGNVAMHAGRHFMDGADTQSVWTVTGALRGATRDLLVHAKEAIVLKVGSTVIELTPRGVAIRGASYALAGAESLVALSKRIDHNT